MHGTSDSAVRINLDRVSTWLEEELGTEGPFQVQLLAGGRSNLTYLLDSPTARYVLRRPPAGDLPQSAHDVLREARLLASLHGTVPVPRVYATCDDLSVIGVPFVIMEHLDGIILRTPADVEAYADSETRARAGLSLVDALIDLHAVDVGTTSLSGLAGRTDYVVRQLHRWDANWKHTRTRDLPDLAAAHDWLVANVPAHVHPVVIHGDFRLDNCMLDERGNVLGLLDWELATVGDPMADLGQLLVYWAEPSDDFTALASPPTSAGGFPTRDELASRYVQATGDDPVRLQYFITFNWWKVACILENVYSRMLHRVMGEVDRPPESFGDQARALAAMARRRVQMHKEGRA